MSILWTEKYRPETFSDISGQGKALKEISGFLESFKPGKALLLAGKPGIGKTLSIETICREKGWLLMQMNASDSRTSDEIQALLGQSSNMRPLFHKKKVILIDEVDGISSRERGATKTLIDIVKKSSFPIVFIANDPWLPKLKSLRNHCVLVKFSKVTAPSIEKKLKSICDAEGIEYDDMVIKSLARWSGGDLRSAIIDLQAVGEGMKKITEDDLLSLGFRERETDMFSILPTIFRAGKISVAKRMIWDADKDADMVFWWIENNIPVEFSRPEEIQRSLNILSKADIYRSYVSKQQNWRFKAYMVDLMSAVSVGRKEEPRHGWMKYEAPSKIAMMAFTKNERAELKELYGKIGSYAHLSNRGVKRDLLPYLRIVLQSGKFRKNEKDNGQKPKPTSLMSFAVQENFKPVKQLLLNDDEIAMLLD
ncbi:MAG: replication factor C large subunit [Candidatus Aenigmarchaeota archaeon]|nr:replication factor C large subunit [Candidatus Aenigmarchaeota archaeon]